MKTDNYRRRSEKHKFIKLLYEEPKNINTDQNYLALNVRKTYYVLN